MEINRIWAMPRKDTFSIKPIKELIDRYKYGLGDNLVIVDPFARNSHEGNVTNDIDPSTNAIFHMDALDFMKSLDDNSADMLLFDPPYSPRQVSEHYKSVGREVNMETTQASFWSRLKDEAARIMKQGGIAISFGWNSMGMTRQRGFEIVEILLVPHGGYKNDTIVTVDKYVGL